MLEKESEKAYKTALNAEKGKDMAESAVKGKGIDGKHIVTLDTSIKDVLKWDLEGKDVYFDDEDEKFLFIPEDIVKELSLITKQRYKLAKRVYDDAKKDKEKYGDGLEYLSKIKVSGRYASATQKLKVHQQKKGFHVCYKRPDEVQSCLADGYRIAKDVKTFNSDVGSVHYVGSHGEPELILMEIPEEEFQKRLKRDGDKSRKFVDAAATDGLSALGANGILTENKASTEKISKSY